MSVSETDRALFYHNKSSVCKDIKNKKVHSKSNVSKAKKKKKKVVPNLFIDEK